MARIGRKQAKPAPKASPNQTKHDPRVWGAKYQGRGPVPIGIALVLFLLVGSYVAYVKDIPGLGAKHEVTATFANATTLRETSPVRVAGVNVGKVINVEAQGDAAAVTMEIDDSALPLHEDATAKIRPRLFLEGNFFVDLRPGTPSAPELEDGGEIPMTQTATSVQIDEVLAALQSDTREGLKGLLSGFGTALTYQPSAIDDADQEPSSRGKTGAQALADSLRFGGPAGRGTAIVNEALLGENPDDLSGLIRAQRDVFRQLSGAEAELQSLITAFNTTAGALADEQDNVRATLSELAPTLEEAEPAFANLNDALPPFRELSLTLRPGVAELPDLFEAATPWLDATDELLDQDALAGLAEELKRGTPATAGTTRTAIPLMNELTDLSRCVTNNLDPTFDTPITVDPNVPAGSQQPVYLDFLNAAVNISGAASLFDGNGSFLRVQTSGGPQRVQMPNPDPGPQNNILFANAIELPQGAQPALPLAPPEYRIDVDCKDSAPADLNGPVATAAPPVEVISP